MHVLGLLILVIGICASALQPAIARRLPSNAWFVLCDGRFAVPRAPLGPKLVLLGPWFGWLALGGWLAGTPSSSPAFIGGVAGLALAVIVAQRPVAHPVALTPDGIRIWRLYRFRTLPWTAFTEIPGSFWRPLAMPHEWLNSTARYYHEHPEARVNIGTGAEYDQLPARALRPHNLQPNTRPDGSWACAGAPANRRMPVASTSSPPEQASQPLAGALTIRPAYRCTSRSAEPTPPPRTGATIDIGECIRAIGAMSWWDCKRGSLVV